MRSNRFIRFQRAADGAGYPTLLLVAAVCLALVVAPVALLALWPGAVALAFALIGLVVALAILSMAMAAIFADTERPNLRPADRATAGQPEAAVSARERSAATRPAKTDREAA